MLSGNVGMELKSMSLMWTYFVKRSAMRMSLDILLSLIRLKQNCWGIQRNGHQRARCYSWRTAYKK